MSILIDDTFCDILQICRLCLRQNEKFVNVFMSSSLNEETRLSYLIHTLGNTEVSEEDGLPPQICLSCEESVMNFYKFRLEIQQNYRVLHTYLQKAKESKANKTFCGENESKLENENDDELFLSQLKYGDDFDEFDADNDEDCRPVAKEKSKKKKTKKISDKKRKKKSNLKEVYKTKKVTKSIPLTENNKSHDKLSAALQKRLENRDKCPLCFDKLKENETMAEHFYSHYNNSNLTPLIVNGKKTTMCNLCNKNYKFNSMIPHHRKHLKLYPFKCEIEGCDKAFASTMNLGWHLDNHNGVKKYQCQTCGKTFHLSGSLRNHEETHIIERAQCKICLKTYKNHIMLKLHMKRHIYGQRHKCEEPGCDKAFYSAQELRRHAHVHYGSKTFVCEVCSKPWYTEKELIRHKKYHDPVKQHQCSECMKTFVDKSQLRCHEMTHRGERPHACEYCNTGFITKSKLKRHQVKSCKAAKPYQITL